MGGRPANARGDPGLLPVARLADGAVGRPGRTDLHRRRSGGRDARSQRASPASVLRVRRRPGGLRIGGRRRVHAGPGVGAPGQARPRADDLRRPGERGARARPGPPDHLRERFVMSLRTLLGPRDPLLWERPEGAALLEYDSFFLFRPPGGVVLDATWHIDDGPPGLRRAVEHLAEVAVSAAQHGSGILV